MNIGTLVVHDPGRASPLTSEFGRSPLGKVIDAGRSALGTSSATVVTLGQGDTEIARWCRWSDVGYRAASDGDASALYREARTRGWTHVLMLSAHVEQVPIEAVNAAVALVRWGGKEVVIVGPAEGQHPLAQPMVVTSTEALQEASVRTNTFGALVAHVCGRRDVEVPLPDVKPEPGTKVWRGAVGPLLIAEIGGNHEGDFEVAKAMTTFAISSGADCVKFQLYRGETLVSPVESPDRHRHFQRFELTREQHIQLAEMCVAANVSYLASVWDEEMLEWIDPYLTFYKVGSGDLTAWPMLSVLARRGKPILLSTGLATMDEIVQTVDYLRRVNPIYRDPSMLCVMQCTSMYPIPDSDAHLRVMDAFRESLRVSIGYSDHTIGSRALLAAAAMGAEALEFHFTDQRDGKTFRDHKVSLVADEVRALREEIGRIYALRGRPVKVPQESELAEKHEISFRRGVYAKRDILAGAVLTADDLVCLRPAHGTDARDLDRVVGATTSVAISAFAAIQESRDYELK